MIIYRFKLIFCFLPLLFSGLVIAADGGPTPVVDYTTTWQGIVSLVIFIITYALIVSEETIHLRKSKPAIVAAGIIWVFVAITYSQHGNSAMVEAAVRHDLLEFTELFFFLLAAMTYINTMDERGVFDLLRAWLVSRGYSLRKIFWITGIMAFFISPVADNLTTALLMSVVVSTVGAGNHRFVAIACINIVVAANAGGVFSPFGDITTLMVWQKGQVEFSQFFALFIPSLVNWFTTAFILSFAISLDKPPPVLEKVVLGHGAWVVVALFLVTITMAVCFHNFLHLPPVLGMMTGLGLLKLYGYYLQKRDDVYYGKTAGPDSDDKVLDLEHQRPDSYDIYRNLQKAEWDTLMFFYGIILCVGGLGAFGYLAIASELTYGYLGPTLANILVGFTSALIDNIPVMFAVLEMNPDMSLGQWLLVTLTAGVGGSILSIGSAAGVAVMGQCRGIYTFFSHLKWSWAVILGYGASIAVHFVLNADTFSG